MRVTRRGIADLINDQNLSGLSEIVKENGLTLVKAHNGRIVQVRRLTRPVVIAPGCEPHELRIGATAKRLENGSIDYD